MKFVAYRSKYLGQSSLLRSALLLFFLSFGLFLAAQNNASPKGFIPNLGQLATANGEVAESVLFYSQAGLPTYLNHTGFSYLLNRYEEVKTGTENSPQGIDSVQQLTAQHRIDITFAGANKNINIEGQQELPHYFNYYYGYCPDGITNVHPFKKISYKNVWDNIDVQFYEKQGGIEYDFIVHPGGNPNDIQLKYSGAEVEQLSSTALRIKSPIEDLSETIPLISQDGKVKKGGYVLKQTGKQAYLLQFQVEDYNPTLALLIDPWSTYFGGSAAENGLDIIVDNLGNIISAGYTNGSPNNFPAEQGPGYTSFQTSYGGGDLDAIVISFNPDKTIRWSTFYGGEGPDVALALESDANNSIYVTGFTARERQQATNNFPVSIGAAQPVYGGDEKSTLVSGRPGDAFLLKFNPNGTRAWATYYGGSMGEQGMDLAINSQDEVYIVGFTWSDNLNVPNAYSNYPGGANDAAFITKFSTAGNILWGTYYGSSSDHDHGYCITIDQNDAIIIAGATKSSDFPVFNADQATLAGRTDIFLLKFDANHNRVWSTFLGGSQDELGLVNRLGTIIPLAGIDHDINNNIYLAARTTSTDFPITSDAYQNTLVGTDDIILAKYSPNGIRTYSSFIDGGGASLTVNRRRNRVHLLGNSSTTSQNWPAGTYQSSVQGSNNPFIMKFDTACTFICGTYFGNSFQSGRSIHSDLDNDILITGSTGDGLPLLGMPYQPNYAGVSDVFIAELCSPCGETAEGALIVDEKQQIQPSNLSACIGEGITLIPGLDLTTSRGINVFPPMNLFDTVTFEWTDLIAGTVIDPAAPPAYVSFMSANGDSLEISPTAAGTINLQLKINYGSCPVFKNISIDVQPSPSITYRSLQDSICPADVPHDFVVDLMGQAPWVLEIKNPDNSATTRNCATTPCTITVADSGDYIIQKITDNLCFKKLNDTLELDFYDLPSTSIAIANGEDANICPGETVDLEVSFTDGTPSNYGFSYQKDTDPVVTIAPQANNPYTIAGVGAGTYKITQATDANCSQTITGQNITITETPQSTAVLQNKDTLVCPGEGVNVCFNVTGTGSNTVFYTLTRPDGSTSALSASGSGSSICKITQQLGTYVLDSIVSNEGCVNASANGSFTLSNFTLPTVSFTVDKDTICLGDSVLYTMTFTGQAPFEVLGTNLPQPLTGLLSPHELYLKPTQNRVYTITELKDNNCTVKPLMLDTTIAVNKAPVVQNTSFVCNAQSTSYTLTVSLSGGTGNYMLTENAPGVGGTWSGNSWTSNPIPTGTAYDLDFDDENGCGPVKVSGSKNCNCATNAGSLQDAAFVLCANDPVTSMHNADENLDANDVLEFILHDGSASPLGLILDRNSTGQFNRNSLSTDVVYYITAVAGNEDASNSGQVDVTDGCIDYSNNISVMWLQNPSLDIITQPFSVCSGTDTSLALNLSGSQAPFDITMNGQALTQQISSAVVPVKITSDSTFVFTSIAYSNAPACPQSISKSISIKVLDAPLLQNIQFICNGSNTQYTVSFDIVDGDAASYSVTGAGTLSGNSFVSSSLNAGSSYNFMVNDANSCDPKTLAGSFSCNCVTKAGAMMPNQSFDVCEGLSASVQHDGTQILDGNDTLEYQLHDGRSDSVGSVLLKNNSGVFAYDPVLSYGLQYYVTAIAGDDNDGNGEIDANQSCADTTSGVPIIFRMLPDLTSIALQPNDSICLGDQANINLSFTGVAPFDLTYNSTTLTGLSSTDVISVSPSVTTTYSFTSLSDAFCTNTISDNITLYVATPYSFSSSISPILCTGDMGSISINVSGAFGGYTYQWTDQNGMVLASNTNTLTTATPGTYTLMVSDYLGCTASVTETLNPPTPFNIDFIKILNETCFNSSDGNIEVTAPGGKSYRLDGTISVNWQSNNNFVNLDYNEGNNTLKITVENNDGCKVDSTININGLFPITISTSADVVTCPNTSTTLTASAQGGNGSFTYYWDGVASTSNYTVSPNQNSSYTVQAFDSKGCPSPVETINVTLPDPLTQTPNLFIDTVCKDELVKLEVTVLGGKAPYSYSWSDGMSEVSTLSSYDFTAQMSNSYTITTVDDCGSNVVSTLEIELSPVIDVDFDLSNSTSCSPLIATASNTTVANNTSIEWLLNGVPQGQDNNLKLKIDQAGNHVLALRVMDDFGCQYSAAANLEVYPQSVALFDFNPKDLRSTSPLVYLSHQSSFADSLTWVIDSVGTLYGNLKEPIALPDYIAGRYTACLYTNNAFNCPDSTCKEIIVAQDEHLYVPSAFSPNGDGINDAFLPVIGFPEENIKSYSLSIFNRWGELLFQSRDINGQWNGEYNNVIVSAGVYQWKIVLKTNNNLARDYFGNVVVLR